MHGKQHKQIDDGKCVCACTFPNRSASVLESLMRFTSRHFFEDDRCDTQYAVSFLPSIINGDACPETLHHHNS